jgi:hypothetical protein
MNLYQIQLYNVLVIKHVLGAVHRLAVSMLHRKRPAFMIRYKGRPLPTPDVFNWVTALRTVNSFQNKSHSLYYTSCDQKIIVQDKVAALNQTTRH